MTKKDFSALFSSELFRGTDENELAEILKSYPFEERLYKKYTSIFTPEHYSEALAILLRGCADVYKATEKGPLFLSILSPGDIFGMAALFYEKNGFINSVTAREDCKIMFIPKKQLEELFAAHPQIAVNYITVLSSKIHYLNSKIATLTAASPTGRLLGWLKGESERLGKSNFTLSVSLSELAMLLSLGRTSLYRSFDELSEEGKLIRDGKKITLLQ